MKRRHISFSFLLAIFLTSCSMTDNVYNNSILQLKKYRNGLSIPDKASVNGNHFLNDVKPATSFIDENKDAEISDPECMLFPSSVEPDTAQILSAPNNTNHQNMLCDEIILRDGTILNGKVKEITESKVCYTTCDKKKEEKYIDKKEVFMIKYYSGYNEVITALNDSTNSVAPVKTSEAEQETEHMSSIALFLSLAGLVVGLLLNMGFGMIMSALAFVFAITSIIIIDNSKNMKKGSGSAVAAIIISIFTIAVCLYTISLL